MEKKAIVYIGGFELPDRNAAAHRVLSNGKIFKNLGYEVYFIGINKLQKSNKNVPIDCCDIQGFVTYSIPYPVNKLQWLNYITQIKQYLKIIKEINNVKMIILYNFPSIALRKFLIYCKKNKIICIGDVTEWYSSRGRGMIYGIIKGMDTSYRMRILHKKMDGLIVISKYLHDYYKNGVLSVQIPPLVDKDEIKWENLYSKSIKCLNLVYAGSPGMKDQLVILISALKRVKRLYHLDIIGIEEADFIKKEKNNSFKNSKIEFHGYLSHEETLKYIKKANYSCFFRNDNRLSRAGFPTKFVEAISCGTPVITNITSNVADYSIEGRNVYLIEKLSKKDICDLIEKIPFELKCDINEFDYRNYLDKTDKWLNHFLSLHNNGDIINET